MHPDEDTAVLDPEDALEEVLDDDLAGDPEDGGSGDEDEGTPEAGEGAKSLADLSPEEVKELPAVKALLSSVEESYRRTAEANERAASIRALEAQRSNELNQLRGEAGNTLLRAIERDVTAEVVELVKKWDANPGSEFAIPQNLVAGVVRNHANALVPALIANSFMEAARPLEALRKQHYPAFKADEDDVKALQEASLKSDGKGMVAVNTMIMLKADRAEWEPKVREDERQKTIAELKGVDKAKGDVQATKARTSRPQPTNVNGASGGSREAASVTLGKMTDAQFAALPKARQEDLFKRLEAEERRVR